MTEMSRYSDNEITQVHNILEDRKKSIEIQVLRDFVIHALKGISMYAHRARQLSGEDREVDRFTASMLKIALADEKLDIYNVATLLSKAMKIRDKVRALYERICGPLSQEPVVLDGPAAFDFDTTVTNILPQAHIISFQRHICAIANENVCMEDLCIMGLEDLLRSLDLSTHGDASISIVYGFLHDVLNSLACHPSTEELSWIASRIEQHDYGSRLQPRAKKPRHVSPHTGILSIHPESRNDDLDRDTAVWRRKDGLDKTAPGSESRVHGAFQTPRTGA